MKEFETDGLILRKFKTEDAKTIYETWIKSNRTENVLGIEPKQDVVNEMEIEAIVNSFIRESAYGELKWLIEEKETKKLIGYVGIKEISTNNKVCGIMFNTIDGDKYVKEHLKKSLRKICNYLIKDEGYESIFVRMYEANSEKSKIKMEALKEAGMKCEVGFEVYSTTNNNGTVNSKNLTIFTMKRKDLDKYSEATS